jgi:hypothetical protein
MHELVVKPALDRAMKEVLERMFFLEACTCVTPEFRPGSMLEARLRFAADPSGSFCLRVSADTARAISADFLGVGPGEVADRQIGEVVCELANMVCGSLLSRVESAVPFRLGPPEIASAPACGTQSPIVAIHSVETASGPFTAILTTEDSACPEVERLAF